MRAGVALNPSTPLDAVKYVLDLLDLLLVMTVNPGFGGQDYIAAMEPKIAAAKRMFDEAGVDVAIEVDGGISPTTAPRAAGAGATFLVAGSAILGHPDGKAAAVADDIIPSGMTCETRSPVIADGQSARLAGRSGQHPVH